MKRIHSLAAALFVAVALTCAPTGGHLAAQSAPDTCWVEGYLFGNDMAPARLRTVEVRKVVKAGYLFVFGTAKPQTDTSGFVRFPVPCGSTAYLYADLPGLRTTQPDGVALAIPNTPTARIETLVPASPVPPSYVVAVPPQRYRVLENGTMKVDTVHTLDIIGGTVTEPSDGTARVTITAVGVDLATLTDTVAALFASSGRKFPWARIDTAGAGLGGGAVTNYGDSIRVADSLARSRRTFISRISTAITLDSSTDAAGRIYYTVSLHPDSVQAWLRDSSMTWMLGRVVQLADSGIAERGYMTPTQIRTLLAGYSVTGHAHAIADVTGLATALADTASSNPRLTNIETTIQLVRDTLTAVSLRATSTKNDLTGHVSTADAHLPSQTGANGKFLQSNGAVTSWQTALTAETDPTVAARIKDSLALYNLGIMRGDSAALTKVLDMIYPRNAGTGGGGAYNLDSARFALSDTAYIAVTDSLRPKRQNSPTAYVMGWTEFQIVPNRLIGANATMTGQIVSDSANGVKIMAWRFEGWGYLEFQTGFGGYMDLFFSNDGTKFVRDQIHLLGGRWLDMLLIGDQTTQTNVRVQLYCNNGNASYGLATIRVFYVAPATSTSSQPIRLIGW